MAWSIFMQDGEPFRLDGKNVSLYLKNMFGRKELNDFVVTGNIIQWTFYGKDQKNSGKYSLELVINEGEKGMITTDKCDFVNLVSCSCKLQGGEDAPNVETESIELTSTLEYVAGGGSYDDTALWNELENKVDKEKGKGLSSNDYTNADKQKLAGLKNYDDTAIKADLAKKADKTEIPTKLSQLEQDIEIGGTPDWNAKEGEVGYIANKPCFSLKTVNGRLDNLNPYFNTDFENGTFYPKHDLYVEYENKTIFMCKKDTELYYGDGITIIDDNENWFCLDGDSETGEIHCVGGGYDFELIFSLDKKYIGFQSTEDTTVTPDWSAPEGEQGHILNRPCYYELSELNIFETDVMVGSPYLTTMYGGDLFRFKVLDETFDIDLSGKKIPTYDYNTDIQHKLSYTFNIDTILVSVDFYDAGDGALTMEFGYVAHEGESAPDELTLYCEEYVVNCRQRLSEGLIPQTIARKSDLTELSTQVGTLSEKIENLPSGESDVFEAIKGETSYDEIKAAFEANKVVYCYWQTRIYMLTKLEGGAAYFAVTHGNYYYRLVCYPGTPSTSWDTTSENFQHTLKSLDNGNAQITIAGKTAEVATPQYVENLLGTIINGEY